MDLSREQVYNNLKKVLDKIKDIKDKKGKINLKSGNLFLEEFGCIQDNDDTNKLLYIYSWLGEFKAKVVDAAKAIGLPFDEKTVEIQGLTIEEWQEDVKLRVVQLNEKVILKKLEKIQETLEKHLSEDDAFKLDMDKVADDLKLVNLDA